MSFNTTKVHYTEILLPRPKWSSSALDLPRSLGPGLAWRGLVSGDRLGSHGAPLSPRPQGACSGHSCNLRRSGFRRLEIPKVLMHTKISHSLAAWPPRCPFPRDGRCLQRLLADHVTGRRGLSANAGAELKPSCKGPECWSGKRRMASLPEKVL